MASIISDTQKLRGVVGATINDGATLSATVTLALSVSVQPLASVTVTVYMPVELTVMAVVVAVLLQTYPVPPDAVSSTYVPGQMVCGVFGFIVAVGKLFTVTTVADEVLSQPFA